MGKYEWLSITPYLVTVFPLHTLTCTLKHPLRLRKDILSLPVDTTHARYTPILVPSRNVTCSTMIC